MKLIISFLICIMFQNIVLAQFTSQLKGLASFARFNHSETYFVLSEREELATAMKTAIEGNWNITPAHFITESEFIAISKDRDKSFVYIHKVKAKGFTKEIKVLALVNGGYEGKTNSLENLLAYVSLDNKGYEANELDVLYRMSNLIHQLQEIVTIVKSEKIEEKSVARVRNKMIKYYDNRIAPLKDKILLIDKRYLSQKIMSESEIVKAYKYDVLFVPKETIYQAILNKDSKYAYLISSLNLYKINTVTDCESGNIIYANFAEEDKYSDGFDRTFSYDDMLQLSGHAKSGK